MISGQQCVVNSDRDSCPNCQNSEEEGGDEGSLKMWLFVCQESDDLSREVGKMTDNKGVLDAV